MSVPIKNLWPDSVSLDLPWTDPLLLAAGITPEQRYWALLYSGMETSFTGRYSYLALQAESHIRSDDWSAFEASLQSEQGGWIGYLSYGLGLQFENIADNPPSGIAMPLLWMIRYRLMLVFDHQNKKLTAYARTQDDFAAIPTAAAPMVCRPQVNNLAASLSKKEYDAAVHSLLDAINNGVLYQANLTRKFYGTVSGADPFGLFARLCQLSPSPYSAFLHYDSTAILSSSPEQFLAMDDTGTITTRPIKGSARRFADKEQDERSRGDLLASAKNRAENLMIVDLMRNDLARSCLAGTVIVKSLFDCASYRTIHHLSSTIQGLKRPQLGTVQVIKQCFPPGSMTGTPKIKAMEYCRQLEKQQRGIYSGCLGWMTPQQMELSVIIRTLIFQKNRFEFQVGGAIVADSTAEEEWQETLTKASAIAEVLSIPIEHLAKL